MQIVYEDKKALLIAGGGTLGNYVVKELLEKGCYVDVICLEEKHSDSKRLTYYQENVTIEYLQEFLENKYYDAIVNFLHYETAEKYQPYHELISAHTKQVLFLSSYRVYADEQHPITESAPFLADVVKDDEFFETETYALGKTRCERYLRESTTAQNWTIVRPVISFSHKRFDVIMHTLHTVIDAAKEGTVLQVPITAKNIVAGLDWAGNSGKLIANLLFKEECIGEAYTISSGQNATWGEVAEWYTEILGTRFEWIDTEEYKKINENKFGLIYDRLFDRAVDCTKVLDATGLTKSDFLSVKEGIKIELAILEHEKGSALE